MGTQVTVIVVGSINADLVAHVDALPKPGETVTGSSFDVVWGGKGANQATAAAALGARTYLVGAVGDDEWGTGSLTDLGDRGVDTTHVEVGGERTGIALIQVDAAAENTITVVPGANATVSAAAVARALGAIEATDAVVVSNLEIPVEAVSAAAGIAESRGWAFVLNPAPAVPLPAELLARVSVATPNETEAETLGSVAALLEAGVRTVIVTRGGDGADIHTPASEEHVDASPATPVDTVGAGDAFTAALAVAIAEGRTLTDAVAWAGAVGAIATETHGARLPRVATGAVEERLRRARSRG